jgi:alcohol dehydrogenase (NADP+)
LPSPQNLLKLDGKLVTVGVPPHPLQLPTNALIFGRKSVAGSLIGGIKETQEMLDFCGEHNITSDVSPPGACTLTPLHYPPGYTSL